MEDSPEDLQNLLQPLLETWPENLNRRLRHAGRPELQVRVVNGQSVFPPISLTDLDFCAQIVKTMPNTKVQYTEF